MFSETDAGGIGRSIQHRRFSSILENRCGPSNRETDVETFLRFA